MEMSLDEDEQDFERKMNMNILFGQDFCHVFGDYKFLIYNN